MSIRRRRITFLGVLFALALARPALPQVRQDDDQIRCPAGGSFRVFNRDALEKPAPVFPEGAKKKGITGTVAVFIIADARGRVSKARACSGPEELRRAAEDAAYRARLRPTMLSGAPVKVPGLLTYTFEQEGEGGAPAATPDNGMNRTRRKRASHHQSQQLVSYPRR